MSQSMEILLAADRFLNTLCGGNSLGTISGRVGRFAEEAKQAGVVSWYAPNNYWLLCEQVIDWGFIPLKDYNHCNVSYENEINVPHAKSGGIRRFLLTLIILLTMGIFGTAARGFNFLKAQYDRMFKN